MIQLLEEHRDLLAELVVNTDVLGRSSGPTGKQAPCGCASCLKLFHALLNDYAQSTYTHWIWKKETDEASWRAQVVIDSVNDSKEKAFGKGAAHWEALTRDNGLSNILQRWYKQIDYLPPKDYYVIGAGGEEYPSPGDLIYLIAVVLEQMQYFAESNGIIFKKDSEERRLSEEWCDLAKSLRLTLEYGFERASRPDWGDKPSGLKRLFSNW